MFLEISQNSQENTCVRGSFLIKLENTSEFCEISKNNFLHRTPLVAASGQYELSKNSSTRRNMKLPKKIKSIFTNLFSSSFLYVAGKFSFFFFSFFLYFFHTLIFIVLIYIVVFIVRSSHQRCSIKYVYS